VSVRLSALDSLDRLPSEQYATQRKGQIT
ncbi:MAG: hypothetical protein RL011_941, partial [Pseudomonadota bacterium]|jgi:hypothetical protein